MENVRNFINSQPLRFSKRVRDYSKFEQRVTNINRTIARKVFHRLQEDVPTDVTLLEEQEMIRLIRAKLGQGKQWSRGLYVAILRDVQEYLEKQLENQAAESTEEE